VARKHVGEFDYGAAARFFVCIKLLIVFGFFLVIMYKLVFADGILAVCLALTPCDSKVRPLFELMALPFSARLLRRGVPQMFSHPAAPPPPQGICSYNDKTGFILSVKAQ